MRAWLLLLIVLLASPAAAHHGWNEYDADPVTTLTGTVREAEYAYPHCRMRLDVDGKTWLIVLAPPSLVGHRGLSKEALRVGNTITVVGLPSRKHGAEMRAERVVVDGKTIDVR